MPLFRPALPNLLEAARPQAPDGKVERLLSVCGRLEAACGPLAMRSATWIGRDPHARPREPSTIGACGTPDAHMSEASTPLDKCRCDSHAATDRPPVRTARDDDRDRQRLRDRLETSFAHEDLDPNSDHPAERTLGEALFAPRARPWLVDFCADDDRPEWAASLLLCLCRLPALYLVDWEEQLIARSLACNDAEIRDAAVQLATAWGGDHLHALLVAHRDGEAWLQAGLDSVLATWDA